MNKIDYTSVMCGWFSTYACDKRNLESFEKNLFQQHFVHYKSDVGSLGSKPMPPWSTEVGSSWFHWSIGTGALNYTVSHCRWQILTLTTSEFAVQSKIFLPKFQISFIFSLVCSPSPTHSFDFSNNVKWCI
jgi:hypothetical protein